MSFKIGDKITCVNDDMPPLEVFKHFDYWIQKDKDYVVRGTRLYDGIPSVLLEGLRNPSMWNPVLQGNCEPGYAAERFRKMAPQKDLALMEEFENKYKLVD